MKLTKLDNCKKCGSDNYFIGKKGQHTGIFCNRCGKWVKWIKKDDIYFYGKIYDFKKLTN